MTCKCIIFHNLQKLFIPYHTIKISHLKPPIKNIPLSLINTSKIKFLYNKISPIKHTLKHTTKKHKHKHKSILTPSTPSTRTRSRVHLPSIHIKQLKKSPFKISTIPYK